MQYGIGSETFADHPETYLNFYGTIKMKIYYGKAVYNHKEINAVIKVPKRNANAILSNNLSS